MTLLSMLVAAALSQAPGDAPAATPPPSAPPPVEAQVAEADAGVPAPAATVATPALAPASAAAVPAAVTAEPTMVRLSLKDGQSITGRLLETAANGALKVALGNGAVVVFPPEAIDHADVDARAYRSESGELYFVDPNRTRYLFGPSAMPLKKNEIYFSQIELLASTLNWGVTDWATIEVGGVVPAWFVPPIPQGFNLLLGGKVATPITDKVHIAAGALMLWLPGVSSAPMAGSAPMGGLGFGAVTYGDRDRHVTLAAGLPIILMSGPAMMTEYFKAPIVSLSGNYRVGRSMSLVTENWFYIPIPQPDSWGLINSLALRVMGDKLATDVGFVLISNRQGLVIPIPVPWLNFTYNFF